MIFDLAVIGGGPAGCAAAITAARHGAKVVLLERGRFPRHKVCGEFVSSESLGLLRDLLCLENHAMLDGAPRIFRSRIFLDDAELSAEISPAALSISRFDLDWALWHSAETSGVAVREKTPVKAVIGSGPFTLTCSQGCVEARAVINAAGRWSNLTSAGIRKSDNAVRWIGLKAHFTESSRSESVDLYFIDAGYCGVQPVKAAQSGSGNLINACAMVRADFATTLKEVFSAHPTLKARSSQWKPVMDPVSTSPLIFHDPEPVQAGMLQAGDAATFVDPFIGDGISLALRSGSLAGECLVPFFREESSLDEAARDYARLYGERLAPVFRASSRLRRLMRWPAAVRKPALSILERTPVITRLLVKMTR